MLNLVTAVTWPGVTDEQQNMGVLTLMIGVAWRVGLQVIEATKGAGFGLGV